MKAVTTYYGTAGDSNLGGGNCYGYRNGNGGPGGRRSASGRSQDFEMNEVNALHDCRMPSRSSRDKLGLRILRTESRGNGSTRTIIRKNCSRDYPECSDSVREVLSQDSRISTGSWDNNILDSAKQEG